MELKKSLGQCFLQDRNILALEAKLAGPQGKTVLEIGPGDGRLTEAVLALKPKKVIAVEKDSRFASLLRERFAGKAEIIEGDFLEAELPSCDIIIGNIPYYISSDIVFTIAPLKFERAVLMVQKEFAQKMVAKPGEKNYGRLSVTAHARFRYQARAYRAAPPLPPGPESGFGDNSPHSDRSGARSVPGGCHPLPLLSQEQIGPRRSPGFQVRARGIGETRGVQGSPRSDADQGGMPGDRATAEKPLKAAMVVM